MLPLIVAELLKNGLSLVANTVLSKGKEYVEEKTGIKLGEGNLSAEQLTQIRQWELENEQNLRAIQLEDNRLDVEVFKLQLQDVQSARNREVEMERGRPWYAPSTTTLLAFTVLLGGGLMLVRQIDESLQYAIVSLITLVLGYYFGSTKTSGDKTKLISELSKSKDQGV